MSAIELKKRKNPLGLNRVPPNMVIIHMPLGANKEKNMIKFATILAILTLFSVAHAAECKLVLTLHNGEAYPIIKV